MDTFRLCFTLILTNQKLEITQAQAIQTNAMRQLEKAADGDHFIRSLNRAKPNAKGVNYANRNRQWDGYPSAP